ncbi:MAG: radical SAM protein [Deltaproteobacteria bacterium]|nr:radical SAM protein [Deltaproteobacteria bacterium]
MGLPIVDDDVTRSASFSEGAGSSRRSRYALRVSVLEQCQLDCRYCRPGAVTSPTETARWLAPAEHARLAALFFARGVEKVRFTGGEPTLRKDLVDVVAAWGRARPAGVRLALTTNALKLAPLLPALRDAGLDGVTVHLDTLRPDRVSALMGTGACVDVVWSAVDDALRLGFDLKWNVVVQKGRNDDELGACLDESKKRGLEVRFIELMNTGSARGYVKEVFLSGKEIVDVVARERGVRSIARRHPSDPAALHETNDGVVFGVIASDTEPFCGDCDRLRLSADGRLRGCLYQPGGLPLGGALRAGASDEALLTLLDAGLDDKRSHHPLVQAPRLPFSMADVGG